MQTTTTETITMRMIPTLITTMNQIYSRSAIARRCIRLKVIFSPFFIFQTFFFTFFVILFTKDEGQKENIVRLIHEYVSATCLL